MRAAVIDTNVVVAGLITGDDDAPAARTLDGMMRASLPFVLSVALLAEYRRVLLRDRIRAAHGLDADEIDAILTTITSNAIFREPGSSAEGAPDSGDQHLWDLLAGSPDAFLVTGDRALMEGVASGGRMVSPREFLD